MEDSDGRFDDMNEEFSKVVKVDTIIQPPEEPKAVTPKVPSPTQPKAVIAPKVTAVSKPTTKPSSPRLPSIEDSEGFEGRRPQVDPFHPGEKVVLSVNYFNMTAGDLTIEVKPYKIVNDKRAYHFQISVETNRTFSRFYNVRNIVETLVDFETLLPQTLSADARESSRIKESKTYFDWDKSKATIWEKVVKKNGEENKKKKTWNIEPYSQNIISAAYYLRAFQMKEGKTISFHIADNEKNYILKAEVLRRENLKTEQGTLATYVVRPSFTMSGRFKPTGENLIWFTADDRKLPVRFESKIKLGTLVASLKSIQYGSP